MKNQHFHQYQIILLQVLRKSLDENKSPMSRRENCKEPSVQVHMTVSPTLSLECLDQSFSKAHLFIIPTVYRTDRMKNRSSLLLLKLDIFVEILLKGTYFTYKI